MPMLDPQPASGSAETQEVTPRTYLVKAWTRKQTRADGVAEYIQYNFDPPIEVTPRPDQHLNVHDYLESIGAISRAQSAESVPPTTNMVTFA